MNSLLRYDLSESFIRRFHPVIVSKSERSLFRYWFDDQSLRFFQTATTGQAVPQDAIWSITEEESGEWLVRSGQRPEAAGYLVTEIPSPGNHSFPLIRRLSYRQKVQRSALLGLLRDLAESPLTVPAELRDWIEWRAGLIGQ